MFKPKVFVASSTRAIPLVDALERSLNRVADVVPWNTEKAVRNNKQILSELKGHANTCEFAVVLFTDDDTLIVPLKKGKREEVKVPRPNCVFEFGLFVGGFEDTDQCLFLSSVNSRQHPSDLAGQKYEPLSDVTDAKLRDRRACDKIVKRAAAAIRGRIANSVKRRVPVRGISIEELLKMEQDQKVFRSAGGPQPLRQVLVRAAQPAESQPQFARVVWQNLQSGIDYYYLFDAQENNCAEIARMLQTLVVAPFLRTGTDSAARRERFIDGNIGAVKKRLSTLKRSLFIEFVPDTAFEELCIHNPRRQDEARGYLKWAPDRYLEIPEGGTEPKAKYYARFMQHDESTIFNQQDPLVKKVRTKLEKEITKHFSKSSDAAMTACF